MEPSSKPFRHGAHRHKFRQESLKRWDLKDEDLVSVTIDNARNIVCAIASHLEITEMLGGEKLVAVRPPLHKLLSIHLVGLFFG